MLERLWIAAGAVVLVGFILRPLGSLLHRAEVREAGIAVIGVGLVIALVGWFAERRANRRHLT
ncbi:MAG TPA: hypothetical protein VMC10_04035 [Stellaceae bacterium]|nr:hypothetical protein [Stellaceae bacterium]